jgi:subtilisin family serine protease
MPHKKFLKKVFSLWLIVSVFASIFFITAPAYKISAESYIDSKVARLTEGKKFMSGTILVKFKGEDKYQILPTDEQNLNSIQARSIDKKKLSKEAVTEARSLTKKNKVKDALKNTYLNPEIEYAQPNYLYEISWTDNGSQATPNDYNMDNANDHWYYDNSNVQEMWYRQACHTGGASCGGDSGVTVAVLDTGVAYKSFSGITLEVDEDGYIVGERTVTNTPVAIDYSSANIHVNSGEVAGNDIDDDGNGYVDDVNGIDTFAKWLYDNFTEYNTADWQDKYANPIDLYGHGSFVAGNILGTTDNSTGAVSPAHNVTLLPIAVGVHYSAGIFTDNINEAIDYAVDQGADVINMSFGGSAGGYDQAFLNSINNAYNAGVTLVAASGNDSSSSISYPAGYSNVIAVGSLNDNNTRSSYSNYGTGLDIMAYVGAGSSQGYACYQETLACYGSCDYTNLSNGSTANDYSKGTSFASPQVAAAAALVKSRFPSANPAQIKDLIIRSAVDINNSGYDLYTGYGAINFENIWTNDLDTAEPTGGISINNDSSQTNSSKVTLNISANDDLSPRGLLKMKISNQPLLEDASWENYSTSKNWTLLPESGNKSVYIQFKDNANNESTIETDSITMQLIGSPVYRFWSDVYKRHFYTIDVDEKQDVQNNNPDWNYEWVAFNAFTKQESGTVPVYRFWSDIYKSHFYTIDENEKNDIIINNPYWRYEWIAFYTYPNNIDNSKPLYRFWSDAYEGHFYTSDPQEKQDVQNNNPNWRYEWIAFYVK